MISLFLSEDLVLLAVLAKLRAKKHGREVAMAVVSRDEGVPQVFHAGHVCEKTKRESERLASKALAMSDDGKRMTTRMSGDVAGGVPIYKTQMGRPVLIGAIGVSGADPEIAEDIALAASQGVEAGVDKAFMDLKYRDISTLPSTLPDIAPSASEQMMTYEPVVSTKSPLPDLEIPVSSSPQSRLPPLRSQATSLPPLSPETSRMLNSSLPPLRK